MDANDIFDAAHAQPITEILIGDKTYPFGLLSPEQHADISAWGTRIVEFQKGGTPLSREDMNPTRVLRALLDAGTPGMDWTETWRHVRPEHVQIANKEYWRQACIIALGSHQGEA